MSTHTHYLIVDVETAPHPDAAQYLEPVQAAKHLRDPEKIAADLALKEAERRADLGLDWNVNRIVAIGTATTADADPIVWRCPDEVCEAGLLTELWRTWEDEQHPHVVGFRLRTFDWPVLIQRSRLLGVRVPTIDMRRWGNRDWTDLSDLLTFDGLPHVKCMRETQKAFARRFGIAVPDETDGKDIAALVAAGDWAQVVAHCAADVRLTRQLAQRISVIS